MLFVTEGEKNAPAILFFHAMGVTGTSSERVAEHLKDKYFCIMPTSTVYCEGQKYISKSDEIRQIEDFLQSNDVKEIALVVASSIGADLAVAFLSQTKIPVLHVFFDGGQFAKIGKITRRILTPFLYYAIKSVYKKNGENLGKIMWCDDKEIRQYLTTNSAGFHAHLGFTEVGRFHRCGYKFGRWYHMIWMEKEIAGHRIKPSPVTGYPALGRD